MFFRRLEAISHAPELADTLKSSDGIDLVREAVRLVFQELIESELS